MDIAKVFVTGRSQAVRLPKAYRFDTTEVTIERTADGGVLLRPKAERKGDLGSRIRAIVERAGDSRGFSRAPQGELERGPQWWDAQGSEAREQAVAAKKGPRRAAKPAREHR